MPRFEFIGLKRDHASSARCEIALYEFMTPIIHAESVPRVVWVDLFRNTDTRESRIN